MKNAHQHHTDPFPRGPLIGAAALILGALLTVAMVRMSGVGAVKVPDAEAVMVREFRFEDRPDGSIAVIDAAHNRQVETVEGSHGFLRGTLRGLARERKRQNIGPEQPFTLIGRADGRLTLVDSTTGRRVDLESFGPTNAAVFANLMRPDLMAPDAMTVVSKTPDSITADPATHDSKRPDPMNPGLMKTGLITSQVGAR